MKLISKPCGDLATNCYILEKPCGELIIDPGMGAFEFVIQNTRNPLAILCTHGHFDHIFDAKKLKEKFNIPIYLPKGDEILAKSNQFGMLNTPFEPDFLVSGGEKIIIKDWEILFHHFPGHTPGTSMIEIDGVMFSGDFIFNGSIGRSDFDLSDPNLMKQSIQKVLKYPNFKLLPGHGFATNLDKERTNLKYFLNLFD